MAVRIEVEEQIERPVDVVFKFYADDHVRNHPRWDPFMELWLESDRPIGVGTVIHRRNTRSGTPVEGTMEVVEYERDQAITMLTRDGLMNITGRVTFESLGPELTKIALTVDFDGMDESMAAPMTEAIKSSYRKIKELIEDET